MRPAKEIPKKRIKKHSSLQMIQQEEDYLEGKTIDIDQKLINLILMLGKSPHQSINQKQVLWVLRQLGYSDSQIQIIASKQPKLLGLEKAVLKYRRLKQVLIHHPRLETKKENYFSSISSDKKALNLKDFDGTWSSISPEVKKHIKRETFSYIISEFGKCSQGSLNLDQFSTLLHNANKLCPRGKSIY